MMNSDNSYNSNSNGFKASLPGETAILILGIVSIVLFCGLIGFVCGIIALVKAKKAIQIYQMYPDDFSDASYRTVKNGRTCALIGVILSSIYLFIILAIVVFMIIGVSMGM
jgi:hypothetical protein